MSRARVAEFFGGPYDGAKTVTDHQTRIRVAIEDNRRFASYVREPAAHEAAQPPYSVGEYVRDSITHRWEWLPPGCSSPIV